MKNKQQCEATYFHEWYDYRCSKNAKVQRDGKWYCTIHDPVRRKERQDKKHKEWQEEYNKEQDGN